MDRLSIIILIIFALCIIIGFIRGAVKMCFSLLATILTLVIVGVTTPYVSEAIVNYTQTDEWIRQNVEEKIDGAVESGLELTKEVENELIDATSLPDYVKNLLIQNNNENQYKEMGVSNFAEYASSSISQLFIQVTSFLFTFIAVRLVLILLFHSLNIVSKLPVLGGINHLVGGFVGAGIACIMVWFLFLGIMLLAAAGIGNDIIKGIQNNPVLCFLYDMNIIAKYVFLYGAKI